MATGISKSTRFPTGVPPPPRGGTVMTGDARYNQPWSGWYRNVHNVLNSHGVSITSSSNVLQGTSTGGTQTVSQSLQGGLNVTIPLPAGTGGHAGSMTFHNGILTAYTASS